MEPKKNKDPDKLTWANYLLVAVVIAVFYFYNDSHSDILNYPDYLRYIGWVVLFAAVVAIRFKKFIAAYEAMQSIGEKLFYLALSLAGSLIGSLMVAMICLTPFNYCNAYVASKSQVDSVRCTIDAAYIGKKTPEGNEPNVIRFQFMGKQDSILTHDDASLIANMQHFHAWSLFRLVLATHKALLG